MPRHTPIPSPKGTRDLYPDDLLRQRYITEAWRRVSIRHGFEEIAGPTFEMRELYTRKSGEGIVSELFSFRREGGDDDYALRPEFTPTLARMYAAKAASLPSPTKWFTAGPYFRAERPQRGRLREFLQWNCDVIGGELPGDDPAETQNMRNQFDADAIATVVGIVQSLGFDKETVRVKLASRYALRHLTMPRFGIDPADDDFFEAFFSLLDQTSKVSQSEFESSARLLKNSDQWLSEFGPDNRYAIRPDDTIEKFRQRHSGLVLDDEQEFAKWIDVLAKQTETPGSLQHRFEERKLNSWIEFDNSIARGLAYYTGTVFELIADGERAVAGGGRYDNLIELFGGPPTPAVGFGMGDVVLGLLLEDKNLMPEGPDLREALSQPPASLRPEAFIIADDDQAELVEPLLAALRRGMQSDGFNESKPWSRDRYDIRPLHARRSYKAKRKKQTQDASNQAALFTVTINEPDKVELKSMDTRQDLTPVDVPGLPDDVADFSIDLASPVYIGRAIANLLDGPPRPKDG